VPNKAIGPSKSSFLSKVALAVEYKQSKTKEA
jgi:hypothetical protein